MIDVFQKLAVRMRPLRFVAVGGGVVFLAVTAAVTLHSDSWDGDHYLVPAMVGLLWSLSAYAFIQTFQSVPAIGGRDLGFWHRARRFIHRGWYWLLAALFSITTVALIFLTSRLIAIWFNDWSN